MSLRRSLSTPSFCGGGATAAECCGGTTASCAALWCCGPCSIVYLLVLTVYKVPRGLCRRAVRRVRRRRLEKKLKKVGNSSQFAVHPLESKEKKEEEEDEVVKLVLEMSLSEKEEEEEEEDEDMVALENEMWNRFYSAGFWRSLSQAETASSSPKSED